MRTFTLVIGSYNLEVEQHPDEYDIKCKEVEFSVSNFRTLASLIFPFNTFLLKKKLGNQGNPKRLVYRGFTLDITYPSTNSNNFIGICKELDFEDYTRLDDVISAFLDKVDEYLEKTMKTQLSVVYNDFTLEVWETKVVGTPLWNGKCEAINFKKVEFVYLDTLVGFFRDEVDEYLKPTKIEYRGYELEIVRLENSGDFVGKSDIYAGYQVVNESRDEVVQIFKERVDDTISFHIKNLESAVIEKQERLEEYLRIQGYRFDSLAISLPKATVLLEYAIHPDYWDKWQEHTYSEEGRKLVPKYYDFPDGKVFYIRQH